MPPLKLINNNFKHHILLTEEIISQNDIPHLVDKRKMTEKGKELWISTLTRRLSCTSLGLVH